MADTQKVKLSQLRAQFPMYRDVSDEQFLLGLRRKFYPDLPVGQFASAIDYDTGPRAIDEMSGPGKFLAGAGKAFVDVGRGVGQLVGLVSAEDVRESRKRDADLMSSGAGIAGNIVGSLAAVAPTVAIPGAATIPGAAAIGAGLGLLTQPGESVGERLGNAALGGAAGAGGIAAGRALGTAYEAGKAVVAPLTFQGREAITGRVLQRFSDSPLAAANAAKVGQSPVPGVQRTLAEATNDPGLAQLQRTLQSSDPAINSRFVDRAASNQRARVDALDNIAGNDGKRDFYDAARQANAKQLYDQAFSETIDPQALTPALKGQITQMMKRPAMQRALTKGRELAAEQGIKIPKNGAGSVEGLHFAKLALDDEIARVGPGALGATEQRAVMGTRDKLLGFLDNVSPAYGQARRQYAADSLPLNQMDVGQHLRDTLKPPLSDLTPSGMGERINDLARALRDPDAMAAKATGHKGAMFEKIMTPEQQATIRAVAEDAARVTDSGRGKAVGSNTVQNLIGSNLVDRLSAGSGIPVGVWDTMTLPRMLRFALSGSEDQTRELLAHAMLHPGAGERMLRLANTPGAMQRFGTAAQPGLPALTSGMAAYLNGSQ